MLQQTKGCSIRKKYNKEEIKKKWNKKITKKNGTLRNNQSMLLKDRFPR